MRHVFAALVILGWPVLAAAQQPVAPTSAGPSTQAAIGLPLPQIGLPLPSIGLPLSPLGLQPLTQERQGVIATKPSSGADTDDRNVGRHRRFLGATTIVYVGLPSAWGYQLQATPGVVAEVTPASAQPVTGRLRLDVQPAGALQLFVDGEYVGTTDDVGAELELEPGSRRIEIRSPGYETLAFDARIIGLQTITYRGALRPIASDTGRDVATGRIAVPIQAEPAAPPRRQTFYFIPGCYLGNVAPQDVKLPPDCDLSRLITRTP